MKKSIRNRWLQALRAGSYRQGAGALRFGNTFCCLGVLCDLHSKVAFMSWEYDEATGIYRYMGETIVLPREVCVWAGLDDQNPAVPMVMLSTHNDAGKLSFKRIARLIERRL
jgi:hypothetical protein